MTETLPTSLAPRRLFHFDWVLPTLFSPRKTFPKIAARGASAQSGSVWLTPMLILTLTTLLSVGVVGWLNGQAALAQGTTLPPDIQYYTPEQQAQFQEAAQAQQGPVFRYVLPGLGGLAQIWLGWLLVGGMLHLTLTLLGGRGDTSSAMNVVAWAALAFAVRDLVRVAAMLLTHQLITSPGLSGFAPTGDSALIGYVVQFMKGIDLYLVWHIFLIILGVRATNGISTGKAVSGVLLTVVIALLLAALPGFLVTRLSSLEMIRPFFF